MIYNSQLIVKYSAIESLVGQSILACNDRFPNYDIHACANAIVTLQVHSKINQSIFNA